MMSESLKKLKVKRWDIGRCKNRSLTKYVYRIPKKLDLDILEFVEPLGKLLYSFPKTSILKIDAPNFIIYGMRRLKEIRCFIKDKATEGSLSRFETILANYLTREKE